MLPRVMGNIADLDHPYSPGLYRAKRLPGSVHRLNAFVMCDHVLVLRWQKPKGKSWLTGYRIERTREGRDYELLSETTRIDWFIYDPPPGEAWFYRVTAYNNRGAGPFRMVILYRHGRPAAPGQEPLRNRILNIPALPGLKIDIDLD